MKRIQISTAVALIATIAVAACESNSTDALPELLDDSTLTQDVAMSSADAAVAALQAMQDNENGSFLPAVLDNGSSVDPTVTRTITCYDQANAVVPGCSPMSSVRKIVAHVTFDGNRSGTQTSGGKTITWTGALHRVSDDTIKRNFTGTTEISRTHGDVAVVHDTTTFSDGTNSRLVAEAARDTVRGVTFNLPRSNPANKWPISGSIIRLDSVHASITQNGKSASRDIVRKIQIDFPPDAQGNVVLKVNSTTCTLNLNTKQVSNCH